jgi:hypothetical protein
MRISIRSVTACAFASLWLMGCVAGAGFSAGANSSASAGAGASSSSGGGGGGGGFVAQESGPELDDFSFAVKEYTGYYAKAFVTNKLTTFKVPPSCWKKMQDKDAGALHTASFYTGDILEYAKKMTGDDWSDIESQNKDKNVKLIAPMMDDFRNRFMVTVYVEGDDCEVNKDALWLRYWYHVGETVNGYPPKSGRVFITINVLPNVRDVTVDYDDSTSAYTITAPRDIEAKDWHETIEKPFRRRSSVK